MTKLRSCFLFSSAISQFYPAYQIYNFLPSFLFLFFNPWLDMVHLLEITYGWKVFNFSHKKFYIKTVSALVSVLKCFQLFRPLHDRPSNKSLLAYVCVCVSGLRF